MQYCEDKWLFVHVPKTAGESITQILSPHSNYMFDQHDTLFRASKVLKDFSSLFRFGFVRNPFDREVSNYFWHTKLNDHYDISFEDWVKWRYSETYYKIGYSKFRDVDTYWYQKGFGKNPQVGFFISPDLGMICSFIGRYETLQEDWNTIAEKIGVTKELPHSGKTDRKDYRQYYTDELVDIVTEAHKVDLETFNYTFEDGMISKEINTIPSTTKIQLHYMYNYYYG